MLRHYGGIGSHEGSASGDRGAISMHLLKPSKRRQDRRTPKKKANRVGTVGLF
jgi:hypothetical protein